MRKNATGLLLLGMSEGTGPVTTTELVSGNGMRLGSIGKAYKGMEVKIDNPDSSGEGEVNHNSCTISVQFTCEVFRFAFAGENE